MRVSLGDTLYLRFFTHSSTGALADADSTPTVNVTEDGGASFTTGVTVTNVTTGEYKAEIVATSANGYEQGKWYEVAAKATVSSVQSGQSLCRFQAMATPTTEGVPEVDVTHWLGTAAATPSVAGVPEVDVTHWIGTATTMNVDVNLPSVSVATVAISPPPSPAVIFGPFFFELSEATAARRRVYFQARAKNTAGTFVTRAGDPINSWTTATMSGRISKNGAAGAAHGGTFTKVDSTSSPGLWYYEFTAAELDTLGSVTLYVSDSGVLTGDESRMVPLIIHVQVIAADVYDAVRLGLTALPNANAEAAGGLFTRGTGAGQINQTVNGLANVNVWNWLDTQAATPTTAGVPEVDVTYWRGTEPLTMINQRVQGYVGEMAADVVTASAVAASAGAEIADAVWDEAIAGHLTAGTTGAALNGATAPSAASVADAVWDEARSGHVTAGSFGEGVIVSSLTTAALEAIRDKLLDYAYRSGRTVRGLFRRLGASLEYVSTSLNGTTVTFKQPDNSTTEFTVTQDTTAGTRSAVNVTNSETP